MTPVQLLSITLLCVTNSSNAWMQGRRNERFQAFRLDGVNDLRQGTKRSLLESGNGLDVDRKLEDDDTLLIGGLFESLSPLPVHEWASDNSQFDSEWMDFNGQCRGDECDVSMTDACFTIMDKTIHLFIPFHSPDSLRF
uniref:Uncharacterized protein n=1 Tax=Chaetoceros debilis TaxID=122233 RepID=A0A7S3V4Q1_9STRA|mmetsp:Transcript_5836/g.8572  ORF Transcript_5836/g.8572 Transcript_5836/m.8572 type:complete len:139 (+) Transcript_5836:69-485(+)